MEQQRKQIKSVKVTGNKLPRLTSVESCPFEESDRDKTYRSEISIDNELFMYGDPGSIAVIWNNIIGVNSDSKQDHFNYLMYSGLDFKTGKYEVRRTHPLPAVLDSCEIEITYK